MKVKYMGAADIRRIDKGADFGGQLSEPLDRDIVWDWDNNHVVDTSDDKLSGVDETFWELLLEDKENFKDVTDLKRVPTNRAQQTWRAMKKTEDPDETGTADDEDSPRSSGEADDAGSDQSEVSDVGGATTTTTGGSTKGATGGAPRVRRK